MFGGGFAQLVGDFISDFAHSGKAIPDVFVEFTVVMMMVVVLGAVSFGEFFELFVVKKPGGLCGIDNFLVRVICAGQVF